MSDRDRRVALGAVLWVGLILCTVLVVGAVAVVADGAAAAPAPTTATENVTRDGADVVVRVPVTEADAPPNATTVTVTVPATGNGTETTATREGDRFVARVPITALVPGDATANLSSATVRASRNGSTVVDGVADLRYVTQTGTARFANATLVVPTDVRGLGATGSSVDLAWRQNGSRVPATTTATGPNATLAIEPPGLAGVPTNRTIAANATIGDDTVSPAPLTFQIEDAAARATRLAFRGTDLRLVQPLAHPSIGPERVDLTVESWRPRGAYHRRLAAPNVTIEIPEQVAAADRLRVTVTGTNRTLLDGVRVSVPSRPTVRLRIDDGSIAAPRPERLAPYDAIVLRSDAITYLPIDEPLRQNETQPLPPRLVEDGEYVDVGEGSSAILVGDGVRPARVDLTVVPPPSNETEPPEEPDPPESSDPDHDEFVGIWLGVGSIVGLLLVAMVGSVGAVGTVYGVRRLSPARAAAASPQAILAHFLLGGIGGVWCIVAVQSAYGGPVLGSVELFGTTVGMGALLVGTFHGGLTATGLRLGLGTIGAWPTRRVIDETAVPLRIRFTDDEGAELPGEQRVEVREAGDATVVEEVTVAGTTTEIDLPPGTYVVTGQTAERETDAVELAIEPPTSPTPDAESLHLQLRRPGLQVEVTDAATGDTIPTGQVTVTTDGDETKAADVEDGSVAITLPIATGTVSAVVTAPKYDDATVDVTIEDELTTVDVALDPAAGTLVVTAFVAGDPIEGATVQIEPAADGGGEKTDDEREEKNSASDPTDGEGGATGGASGTKPAAANRVGDAGDGAADDRIDTQAVGVREAEVTTDEDGTATVELPAGEYRATLHLDGPNADLFAVSDAAASVQPDEDATLAVYGRFDWSLPAPVERQAAGLESTIRSVEAEATADPTIPLYFAGATEALLACVASLPDSGHQFATSEQDPDVVARATVAAAEAALEAVGQAMQAESVRPVLASAEEPVRVAPDLDADPAALLDYLGQDLTIASVESRAHDVERAIEAAADDLAIAPARSVVEKALDMVPDEGTTTDAAVREFAALLLLDAVEQSLEDAEIRKRLDGAGRSDRD